MKSVFRPMHNSAKESFSAPRQSRRPSHSQLFPWYDSVWLTKYERAKFIVRSVRPDAFAEFVDAFRVFHTQPDFDTKLIERPFDCDTFAEIRRAAMSLRPTDLELHEARSFGRFVVHDHPFFTELQQRVAPLVSEVVGEPVDANYNFLSLYTAAGVCRMHMDAPEAKWTLDLCIDQSAPWPIYLSKVQTWPKTDAGVWPDNDWEDSLKRSQSLRFTRYMLQPAEALVFSGSSQWHYRDAMPDARGRRFCNLLFFHFIRKRPVWTALMVPADCGHISEEVRRPADPVTGACLYFGWLHKSQ